jgi:hypothetical protein
MHRAGVKPGEIVTTIWVSECHFDIFPPVLRDLKMRGVPPTVLKAMTIAPYGPPATAQLASPEPAPQTANVQIPAGTVIEVETATPISLDKSSSGEQLPPARAAQVASTLRPVETASTVDEPEVKESEDESTAAPSSPPADSISAGAPERAQNSLSSGPISTGGKQAEKRGRTVIRLKDGASVEADATWEDQQGIWYRQGGLVSFVEHDRVQAITEPARPKPSPADVATP